MQLNKFKAVAKPRNSWQAIDLGFVMARQWYFQLLLLWALPAGLLYIVLMLFLYDKPVLTALIVWWLKPLWERPILQVISRQLFENHMPIGEVFKTYGKIVKFDLFPWLSWLRFSPYRAFNMPVTQLEKIKGRARRSRLNLLHRRFGGAAAWLLIVCAHVEAFLIFGLVAGFALFLPQGVDPDWSLWLMNNSHIVNHCYNALWLLCAALVAPFYVCAGFSLYLQRRIDLEAWDIEIQFRRLLQRKSARKSTVKITGIVLCCLGFGFAYSFSAPIEAQNLSQHLSQNNVAVDTLAIEDQEAASAPNEALSPAKKAAHNAIKKVYESKDFRNIEQRSGYRLIAEDEKKEAQLFPIWMIDFLEWAEGAGGFFQAMGKMFLWLAKFVKVILWVVVAGLVAFLIYYYRSFILRAINYRQATEDSAVAPPKTLFGLDVTQEGLPEDVVDAAQKMWSEGHQRGALALLLRGSIVKCLDMRCEFASGNTEKECALIVTRKLAAPYSQYFSRLVANWQALAYAHGVCQAETFHALCSDWREVFDRE